ncbi:MAG: phospho-sugar mutase [Clostridia bacterium]|jgi:phosphoglucomutase|nr:phospho-sugar mutase [Clostridia bacterium]
MNATEKYSVWCEKVTDAALKEQLSAMKEDAKAIENAFYKELEFGTGGLRGELGAGTNCLNVLTIGKVTQGIAERMVKCGQKTVAVSCDSRINSDVFKEKVACVMAANGIKAYVTRELMPTPFLSFLTREVKADIGVMITASHNPAKYNGYKVYGSDGCQLTDEPAKEMIGYIEKVDPFAVQTDSFESYVKKGLIEYASDEITEKYLACVQSRSIGSAEGLKVAYSPLNGTGYKLVPEILKRAGVAKIDIVPEQAEPDGNFTTCSYPNPEKPEALRLGLALAEKCDSDILIATDPDADRIGTAVKHNGGYRLMTGNEIGVLLTDYLLSQRKANGTLPKDPVIVTTIVSTSLAEQVAKAYGVTFYNVLTGFKYIGGIIGMLEEKGEQDRFVLGFEESYGYLSGSYVRDKDAVVAAMLVAEMTAHHLRNGKTLVDRIEELYAAYGTYEHKLKSYEYPGAAGNAKMAQLLIDLRNDLPKKLGKSKIVKTVDYLTQTEYDLPKSNVLSFLAENGSKLIVRPSGTEPLIKLYITAASTPKENQKIFKNIFKQIDKIFA